MGLIEDLATGTDERYAGMDLWLEERESSESDDVRLRLPLPNSARSGLAARSAILLRELCRCTDGLERGKLKEREVKGPDVKVLK